MLVKAGIMETNGIPFSKASACRARGWRNQFVRHRLSSASAAAAIAVKGVESRLEVHAPGGSQMVEWNGHKATGAASCISRVRRGWSAAASFSSSVFV